MKSYAAYEIDRDSITTSVGDKPLLSRLEPWLDGSVTLADVGLSGHGLNEVGKDTAYDDITALQFDVEDREMQAEFLSIAPKFPKLDSLNLISYEEEHQLDLAKVFEVAPRLLRLVVTQGLAVSPLRNTVLREFYTYLFECSALLETCSLPNLEVFEAHTLNHDFPQLFNITGFTKLRHFGFNSISGDRQLALLSKINMPSTVCSLLFGCSDGDLGESEPGTADAHLCELATLPFAHQLTHLNLWSVGQQSADCLGKEKFPNLAFLKWKGEALWMREGYEYDNAEVTLPEFFFDDSLSHLQALDLRELGISNDTAQRLLDSPLVQSLDFLYLDYNRISNSELINAFERLPCKVSLAWQSVDAYL